MQEIQSTCHGLYNWSCQFFRDSFGQELANIKEGRCSADVESSSFSKTKRGVALDPLSESGALKLYFMERNAQVLSKSEMLTKSNPWMVSSTTPSVEYSDTLSELQLEPHRTPTPFSKMKKLRMTSMFDGNGPTSNLKVK